MSTTMTTTTTIQRTTRTDRATRKDQAPAQPVTSTPVEAVDLIGKRPASELTRLVFCVLLGIAACVALIGVVDQASTTSPDAPAPAVIVELD